MAFALDGRGGGQALPPFLQGRTTATKGPFQTQPMITPRPMVAPREVKPNVGLPQGPAITPKQPMAAQPTNQPANQKPGTQTLFEFLKRDLENERNQALAGARTSASARGVFYGTPLTTSEGDINTSFLRGLGQLQAGLINSEQDRELQRFGLASNLIGSPASFGELASLGQGNPDVYSTIGSLFAGPQAQAQRPGPVITPKNPLPPKYDPNVPNFRR